MATDNCPQISCSGSSFNPQRFHLQHNRFSCRKQHEQTGAIYRSILGAYSQQSKAKREKRKRYFLGILHWETNRTFNAETSPNCLGPRSFFFFGASDKLVFAECERTLSVNKIENAEDLEEIMGSRVVDVYVLLSTAFKGQRKGNTDYLCNLSQDNNLKTLLLI